MKSQSLNSLLAASVLLTCQFTYAASESWLGTAASGAWSDGTNWTNGTPPGATSGTTHTDTATFNVVSTNQTITVDANRNVQNLTVSVGTTYTIQGSTLLLTSGGAILSNTAATDVRISAPLQIQGESGTYRIETNTPGTNREIIISGGITGVSTLGNTTTLTLTGASPGNNEIGTVGISDGVAGGNLALVKDGASLWVLGTSSSYTGGTTIKAGTLRLSNSGNTTSILGTGPITFDGSGTLRLQSTTATNVNNDVVVNGTGGTVSVRTNDSFNPATLTGTGTIRLTGDTGLTITTTSFKDFGGTISVVAAVGGSFNLRLGTGYVETSMQNAVLDLQAGANLTRQVGTSGTITTHIGNLSGAAGSFLGGSAPGGGTFVFSVGSLGGDSTFSGVIGDGGTKTALTKVGSGTLTLDGINTYTGNTLVSAGTLNIANAYLSNTSTVTIADGGAKMKLSFAGNDGIAQLSLGSLGPMGPGTYNATTHPDYFDATGTGSLVVISAGGSYGDWASLNGATENANEDHDNDGVSNGVEYFIGGPNGDTTGFTALPGVTTVGSVLSVTWTHAADYLGTYGTDYVIQTSSTLALGSWTNETLGGNVRISGDMVTYTFPAGPAKNFVRLVVTP